MREELVRRNVARLARIEQPRKLHRTDHDVDLTRRVAQLRQAPFAHDLRHLAASMMIAAGVPLPIVPETLRHSTISITADVYSHMTANRSWNRRPPERAPQAPQPRGAPRFRW